MKFPSHGNGAELHKVIGVCVSIALLVLISFLIEGRVEPILFTNVIRGWGAGGHYDVFVTIFNHARNPQLFPGDIFLEANKLFIVPLITTFIPALLKIAPFSINAVIAFGEYSSRVMLFCAIFYLARSIYRSTPAALIALLVSVVPKFAIGFYPQFVASDFNADISMALCLFSLGFFFRDRIAISFMLNGLAYNAQPIIPFWLTFIYIFHLILKRETVIRLAYYGGIVTVFGSPFIVALIKNSTAVGDGGVNEEMWMRLFLTVNGSHIYPSFATTVDPGFWVTFSFYMAGGVLSLCKYPVVPDSIKKVALIAVVVAAYVGAAVVFSDIFPKTGVIKMMPARSSLYLLFLCLIFIANFLWRETELIQHERSPAAVALWSSIIFLLAASVIIAPYSFIPTWLPFLFLAMLFFRKKPQPAVGKREGLRRLLLVAIALLPLFKVARVFATAKKDVLLDDWVAAQSWIRSNTAVDDVFVIPIEAGGFRIFSERANFISLSDMAAIITMQPHLVPECVERLRLMGFEPHAKVEEIKRNYFGVAGMSRAAFSRMTEDDFRKIAELYPRVKYLVAPRNEPRQFPVVFENDGYFIYRLAA